MPSHVLALGSFQFSTTTAAYDSLQRVASWEWAEQKRVGVTPLMQYTGGDAETITLPGTIYPSHAGAGVWQLADLRGLANAGKPLALADGLGYSFGQWCIRSISEDQSDFLPGGIPRKQAFTITLVRYHADY